MRDVTVLDPGWEWTRRSGMTVGVRVGGVIYTSGLVALDHHGNLVGAGDPAAQTRQVFANLQEVLAEAGATLEHVIKITTFLTDLAHYTAFAAERAIAFPRRRPTGTTVGTPALALPGLLLELEAIALIGANGAAAGPD